MNELLNNNKEMPDLQAIHSWTVQANDHELRMDRYLTNQMNFHSRNYITDLIRAGRVKKNGVVINKPSAQLQVNDLLVLEIPPARVIPPVQIEQAGMAIEIIFEHPEFLIINKPAGLLVHPPHVRSTEPTLVDWLLSRGYVVRDGKDEFRSGIIHRLDKNTSGIMIIVRTPRATAHFGHLFQERLLQKTYYAIVHGTPPKTGVINSAIIRDPIIKTRMSIATEDKLNNRELTDKKARHAITHFFTLATTPPAVTQIKAFSLVRAEPITGRTHQIRVHLASIGHPLLGDHLYKNACNSYQPAGVTRHLLHAHSISFTFDSHLYNFTAPAPIDFTSLLTQQFGLSTLL